MVTTNLIPTISGIYKFTNKINNKVYIGQAKNLNSRIKGHIRYFYKQNYNYPLYHSMKKHRIENFEVEILQEGNFTKQQLDEMEISFIRLFKSNNSLYGYNLTIGGEGTVGYKHTQETKNKLRKSKLGKKHGEYTIEHRQKISNSLKGKPKSEETKRKLTGRKHTQETKDKISKIHKGKIISEESKEKIKQTKLKNGTWCKKFKHIEETKQKLKGLNKGKTKSKEAKIKTTLTLRRTHFVKKLSQEFYKTFLELNLF